MSWQADAACRLGASPPPAELFLYDNLPCIL
jgi:hypothetical protein